MFDTLRHPVHLRQFIAGLLLGAFASLGSLATATAETLVAETDTGPVTGLVTPTVHKFLGIPYAAPPVGALRWQPPQPPPTWTTPRDATAFAAHCAQTTSPFGQATNTEDCLYLNVYTPHRRTIASSDLRRRRPVMVWIHGGAFQVGESDDYDPTKLVVDGDVVVVTLNYRLGALGFLAHPALSAESPDGVSGNYGILDQQFALRWVQRNIAAFGGNPKRVTIFGESAGGISVHAHLVSPGSAGLFHRAIVQSGAVFIQPTLADAETQGTAQADTLGCTDQSAACLRAVAVADVLANQGTSLGSATPVIDGTVLPQKMLTALKTGAFNHVPVIQGSNHDEMRLFVALLFDLATGPLTEAEYPAAVATLLGVPESIASILIVRYPVASYPSPGLALSALATDAAFACNAAAANRALSQSVHTYAYEFDDTNAPELFLPPVGFPYGAAHASEIQYLFGLPQPIPAPPLNADQLALSDTMVKYWTRFARTGKPNVSHATRWVRLNLNDFGGTMLSLLPPSPTVKSAIGFTADHQCSFWDPLLGN